MAAKPVPQMITSASCSVPSAVRTPAGSTPVTALGDHLDVVAGQRGVPVVGEQQPLAADRVVGHQLGGAAPGRAPGGAAAPPGQRARAISAAWRSGSRRRARVLSCSVSRKVAPRSTAWVAGTGGRAGGGARCTPGPASARRTARSAGRRSARPTRSTMPGTNWIALAPVPTTATRLPASGRRRGATARSGTPGRRRFGPGRSGTTGLESWPTAETTRSASRSSPSAVVDVPDAASPRRRARAVTSMPVRTRSSRPARPAVRAQVGQDLGWRE